MQVTAGTWDAVRALSGQAVHALQEATVAGGVREASATIRTARSFTEQAALELSRVDDAAMDAITTRQATESFDLLSDGVNRIDQMLGRVETYNNPLGEGATLSLARPDMLKAAGTIRSAGNMLPEASGIATRLHEERGALRSLASGLDDVRGVDDLIALRSAIVERSGAATDLRRAIGVRATEHGVERLTTGDALTWQIVSSNASSQLLDGAVRNLDQSITRMGRATSTAGREKALNGAIANARMNLNSAAAWTEHSLHGTPHDFKTVLDNKVPGSLAQLVLT